MQYKGYRGVVSFDDEAGIFHGDVVGTRDVITFQGRSVAGLREAFKDSIDEYLKVCEELDHSPDKAYSGKIPLRVSPEVHRKAAQAARSAGMSLNAWLARRVESVVEGVP